jgi:hypothetical protein
MVGKAPEWRYLNVVARFEIFTVGVLPEYDLV